MKQIMLYNLSLVLFIFFNILLYNFSEIIFDVQNFSRETPTGLRLDHAYIIKKLDGTFIIANKHEAPKATTEILTMLT